MYLKLDLKEDEDFRTHVKDLIRSQVTSIERSQYNELVDKLETHVREYISETLRKITEEQIETEIKRALYGNSWGRELVPYYKKIISHRVNETLQEIDPQEIKELIADKVKKQLLGG